MQYRLDGWKVDQYKADPAPCSTICPAANIVDTSQGPAPYSPERFTGRSCASLKVVPTAEVSSHEDLSEAWFQRRWIDSNEISEKITTTCNHSLNYAMTVTRGMN
jgi:hypothetical protein